MSYSWRVIKELARQKKMQLEAGPPIVISSWEVIEGRVNQTDVQPIL